jgi:hypothetical protein
MSMFDPITTDTIAQEVQKQIAYFDSNVNGMSNLLTFGLNDGKYSKLYGLAGDISIGISGVCLAMAVIYTYLAIVKEGISLRGDWKKVVTILLKLAITKGLIDTSTQFITWIYSFFAKISQLVIQTTTNSSGGTLGSLLNTDDIAHGLNVTNASGIIDRFVALQYAKFLGFGFFILTIMIFIIGLARILKIYVMLAFGAVAFAKIPMYGMEGCKEYIKEMCALGLQGGIIMATIAMFQVASLSIADIVDTTSSWGSLAGIFVLAISMILILFKSEEIARKVV